jgi:hypothetical protein
LAQFAQDVRDIREKKLEIAGKQWYEIQHDRRGYGSNIEDYALKFPTRKSEQLRNQVAYNSEVSVLSGIAKYVGFPAAPSMAPATSAELDYDLKRMGVGLLHSQSCTLILTFSADCTRKATANTGSTTPRAGCASCRNLCFEF